jgi:HPt (histidine-containing phosphotransfer) domain-containing protein
MIDLTFLKKFSKGNTVKMKRYISMYLEGTPVIIANMAQNVKEQDWEHLRINAHSLKPQAEFMGDSALHSVLIEIEIAVKDKRNDSLEALFLKAKQLYEASEGLLNNHLETLT